MAYLGNTVGNRFVASKAATQFSGDGSNTSFTLEHSVASDEDILVSVDGVIQEPSVAYAVSNGTTLTFTEAPSNNSGNNIFVYYLFRTVATVDHPSTSSLQATDGTFSAGITGTLQTAAQPNITSVGTLTGFTSQGIDDNANATAITIDSSENVMINTTNTNPAEGNVVGVALMANNAISACDDGSAPIQLNRKTDDGAVAIFRKDGSTVGQINADGGRLLVASSNAGLRFDNSNSAIFPRKSDNTTSDNLIGLGLAGHRFTSLYLSDGVYLSGTTDDDKLDHYEEGTWTPQLTNGSSNIGTTIPSGYPSCFTRIGNSVHAEFYIQRSDTSSDTNPIILAGLPYAHKQIPAIVGQCWIDNSSITDIRCFLYLPINYQQLYFVEPGSDGGYVTFNEFENGRYMYAAFDYLV